MCMYRQLGARNYTVMDFSRAAWVLFVVADAVPVAPPKVGFIR